MTSVFSACRSCGYDLAGLDAPGVCPECGHAFTERAGDDEITLAWPCLNCAYSLAGLRRNQKCPECGMPTRFSVDPALLRFQPREYRTRIGRGAVYASVGILSVIVCPITIGIVGMLIGAGAPAAILALLAAVASIAMFCLGWFWMLSPPPRSLWVSHRRRRAFTIARWSLVIWVALSAAFWAVSLAINNVASSTGAPGLGVSGGFARLASAASFAVFFISGFVALRTLFVRARSARLRPGGIAAFTFWCGVTLIAVWLLAAVGLLATSVVGMPIGATTPSLAATAALSFLGVALLVSFVAAPVLYVLATCTLVAFAVSLRRVEREIAFAHRGALRPVTTSETPGAERPNTIEP